MKCRDLKVVNLNITEDHYEYKAMMRLCSDDLCFDIDVSNLTDDILSQVKTDFKVEEPISEMRDIIMSKVMEATKIESRISEGKNIEEKESKLQRGIDSLNRS